MDMIEEDTAFAFKVKIAAKKEVKEGDDEFYSTIVSCKNLELESDDESEQNSVCLFHVNVLSCFFFDLICIDEQRLCIQIGI